MEEADAGLIREFYEDVLKRPSLLKESDVVNSFADWVVDLH
jgi:hypothetical protein